MSEVEVRPVSNQAEEQAFLRMPWTVYKDDPNWVAPLWQDHWHFFDPKHNVELKHIDMQKFVAWRGDTPVGTVIAHVNHAYNEFHEENVGWFGQYELLDDQEAGLALLKAAEDWVRAKGVTEFAGPATYSTNSEIGMLVDGFDTPPMILMVHSRPYYQNFVAAYGGFEQWMDLWAWNFDGNDWGGKAADKLPEKLSRVVNKIRERKNFTLRHPDMKNLDKELAIIKDIYNRAWEKNWGFIPLSDAEIDAMADDLKDIVDPRIAFVIEVDGEPIGWGLPLPNLYEPLGKVHSKPGEPHWWQLLRLVWHWKIARKLTSVRVWGLGVVPEYRGSGADALMYYEMLRAGLSIGYQNIEMSWILANNDMMNRAIEMMGAHIYKTYRVFKKQL